MKFNTISSAILLSSASVLADGGPWGNRGGPGGWGGAGLPSCFDNCDDDLSTINFSQGGLTTLCANTTLVDTVNTCISTSNCSTTDKQNTYQALAQICANAGSPLTASPEATYSATSGGTNYPTGTGQWASYASAFSTTTSPPSGPWRPGNGYGPFGPNAADNGYGPWANDHSGAWTNGPWTQCPLHKSNTMLPLPLTTTLLLLLLPPLYLLLTTLHTLLLSPLRTIPGPLPARLTNLYRFLSVLRGHHHLTQRALHARHGPYILLGPNCISTTDTSLINVLYPLQKPRWIKSEYFRTSDFLHPVTGEVLHASVSVRDEEEHTRMVRPVARFYTTTGVLRYESRMDGVVRRLLLELEGRFVAPGRERCEIGEWLHYAAWDLIAKITFGREFGFLSEGRDVRGLIGQSERSLDYMASVGQIPWLDGWVGKNRWVRFPVGTMAEGVRFAKEQLDGRLSGEDEHDREKEPDLLDDFLGLREEDPSITDERLVQWAFRNVAAGSDTTAIEMRAAVYYLAKDQAAQRQLQEELDQTGVSEKVRRGDGLKYKDLYTLPYLGAVIHESLRMHPGIALSLERLVPSEGYILPNGTYLPPGTIVGINPAVINRLPEVFGADADTFNPERWLQRPEESNEEFKVRIGRMKETDMTFGRGKRVCAGRHIAMVEMYKVIAPLFSTFGIRLVDPKKEWKTKNSFFHRQWDMDVYLEKR
ncbi:cytochrome P450 [Elsinoe ampelina]|uniref:Cytochrome P450 n=1 Tax=Elsinoe ampelina TaxID=302913 RepID=A0A6A6GLS3_9PEZI|nr:cytochrome P450 [Elsinoe ampelina]